MVGRIPLTERPQLILGAEAELGITAGLQDRVIQVRRVRACGAIVAFHLSPVLQQCLEQCIAVQQSLPQCSVINPVPVGLTALSVWTQCCQAARPSVQQCPRCFCLDATPTVVQVYGGMMFMDFSPDTGHNRWLPSPA